MDLKEKKRSLEARIKELATREEPDDNSDKQLAECVEELEKVSKRLAALAAVREHDEPDGDEPEKEEERSFNRSPAVIRSRGRKSAQNVHEHAAREGYNMVRAALQFADRGGLFNGVEAEVHQELSKTRSARGFIVPYGVDAAAKLNKRADFTTTTGSGAVGQYWDASLFIDYLYPKLFSRALGATFYVGLQGKTHIPAQTGSVTVAGVSEGAVASETTPTVSEVELDPWTISAQTKITRQFAHQSVVDAERVVMEDQSTKIAIKMDTFALAGAGTTEPTGILNNSSITNYVYATTNAPTWANILEMEKLVAEANAERGNRGWLTSPSGKSKLRSTPKIGSTFPVYLADDNGMVDGYPLVDSTIVPVDLSYCGTNNLTAMVYGNWNDLIIGVFYNGLDVVVDPYTSPGNLVITSFADVDTDVKHVGSFAVMPNIVRG